MNSIGISRLSPIAQDQRGTGMTGQRSRDRMIERLRSQGISHPKVLAAMATVPRHLFVDEALQSYAYEDTALPIGSGQTISQPWVVARMCELMMDHFETLTPKPGSHAQKGPYRVLEIGTGCGYQAAVLSELVESVYTVERIEELLRQARRRLRHQGREYIRSAHSDGTLGWPRSSDPSVPAELPFDAALVAAGGLTLTADFFAQIVKDGVVIAPVGDQQEQTLKVFRQQGSRWSTEDVAKVRFVPLLSGVV